MTCGATILVLCLSLLYNCVQYCAERDNITSTDYLISNTSKIIESAGKKFQLGFFTPPGANNNTKYIGIWYSMDPETVVWVANRDKPLNDFGVFAIYNKDGDLKLLDGANNHLYFSTNLQSSGGSRTAKLLDNGNLVLIDDQKGETLWQSFDHPTDTFLPGMKMDKNLKLTSWKNPDDPAKGNFTFQQDQENDGGYIILKGISSNIYWRSGEDSVRSFNPNKIEQFSPLGLLLSNNSRKPPNGSYPGNPQNRSSNNSGKPQNLDNTRLWMDSTGKIQYLWWNIADTNEWDLKWSEPQGPCSVYNACGDFGSCDSSSDSSSETDKLKCTCFPGFEPSSPDDWNSNDFSGGCNSKADFCASIKQDNDTKSKFLGVNVTKVGPKTESREANDESDCRAECLRNCECRAYYNENGTSYRRRGSRNYTNRCCIWTVDLTDIQDGNADGDDTYNLFIRVADTDTVISGFPEQPGGSRDKKKKSLVFICIVVIVAIALFCSISYIAYRRMIAKRRASIQGNPVFHLYVNERQVEGLTDQVQFREDDKKDIDVPFFELNHIVAATDNFSQANKLGQGGFGPVYKGKFPNGEEIAVKRLSSNSGQGLQEFKNEVVLIAKLQHRNLVRLLGYCIEGNEKILLYEYMPNKSLDAFIFDQKLSFLLGWMKRFDIILGVARGLLYLHQDSRLRIVHRDMKASNILLDEEMNPKISDFGLARIVRGRETEANTNRVVGTYGYMSPEYALEGQFSVKSDVFSFGVIMLEIISGKRNAGFHQSQLGWNLLGYAWSLWKEEKALDLLDHTLAESCNVNEVLKCINVALLCVQEDPGDRPAMSTVLFLLGSQAETLPNPKQPAFISRKRLSGTTSSYSTKPETESRNEITFSMEEGR